MVSTIILSIDQSTPIEGINLDQLLHSIEFETTRYFSDGNTQLLLGVGVNDELDAIRDFVKEQQRIAQEKGTVDNINNVGRLLTTVLKSIEDLQSGDPLRVMSGSLAIVGCIAMVVGGPFGAIVAAVCGVLGALISLSTPSKPGIVARFVDLVHSELNKFSQKLQNMQLGGLRMRVAHLTERLTSLKKGEAPRLLDEDLFVISFPQFIGELSYNIQKGLTKDSTQSDCADCIYSMVAYCNAQTAYFLLLGNLISNYTKIGADASDFKSLLDAHIQHGIETLGFLSEEKSYSFLGRIGNGKRLMIFQLRGNINAYNLVENFRGFLGMSKMKDLKYILDSGINNPPGPRMRTEDYPIKKFIPFVHYFQFINESEFRVKLVLPGGIGSSTAPILFTEDVEPRSSYEHKTYALAQYFSTGGFFVVYLDGQIAPDDYPFPNHGNFKVYEISLSNPSIGVKKIKFIDKSDRVIGVTGIECWNSMDSGEPPEPHYWTYKDKHYVVNARYISISSLGGYAWVFSFQDYDPANPNP